MMNAMRDMMTEFTRNNSRSESGSAEGSAAVEQILRGTVLTTVRETPAAAVGMARDICSRRLAEFRSNGTWRNYVACRGWPTEGSARPAWET